MSHVFEFLLYILLVRSVRVLGGRSHQHFNTKQQYCQTFVLAQRIFECCIPAIAAQTLIPSGPPLGDTCLH